MQFFNAIAKRIRQSLGLKIALACSTILLVVFFVSLPVLLRLQLFQEQSDAVAMILLLALFATVLQFVVTTLIINALAIKPLLSLQTTIKKVEEGQLNATIPITAQDELSQVSESFNQMLKRMQHMHERKTNIEKKLIKTEESLKYKTALENKNKIIEHMNQELSQSFNTVALLYNVSQYLNAVLDLAELLSCVQLIFAEKFACRHYLLYFTHADHMLKAVDSKGFAANTTHAEQTTEFGQGIAGLVAQSQKTVYVEDLQKTSLNKTGLENEISGSLFCAPLVARGKLIGVLMVARAATQAFSSSERQSLEAIATQIANAHDRSVLYTQTKELSVRDELTNVYNRRFFQQYIDKEFKRSERYQRSMSVLMIDVDHFKYFNDTYGHLKGDITLKAIANLLHNSIREVDILARYGGEEFVVLLPNTDLANAIKVAEKLREKVQDELKVDIPPAHGKKHVPITISIGVASYPQVQSLGELIHTADIALYKAKRQGRNRVSVAKADEPDLFALPDIRKSTVS